MEEKVNQSFNEEFIYPDDRNSSLIDGNNENNIFYDEIFKSQHVHSIFFHYIKIQFENAIKKYLQRLY